MPMLFTTRQKVIQPGRPPVIHGDYAGYRAPSFPPATPYPALGSSYAGYRAPSFPPATAYPHSGSRLTPTLSGGFTQFAYNQPPYFSGMGDAPPAETDFLTSAMNWVSANPLLAGGIGLGAVALLAKSKRGRR